MPYSRQNIALSVQTYAGGDFLNLIVPAYCLGALAIHKDLDDPEAHTVSHIRSGLAILDGLSLQDAHRVVKQAQALDLDWTQDGDAIAALPAAHRHAIGQALRAALDAPARPSCAAE